MDALHKHQYHRGMPYGKYFMHAQQYYVKYCSLQVKNVNGNLSRLHVGFHCTFIHIKHTISSVDTFLGIREYKKIGDFG